MKISVFDHINNFGGGSKFVERILDSIKHIEPNWDIHFFCGHSGNSRENFVRHFDAQGINVNVLRSTSLAGQKHPKISLYLKKIQESFLHNLHFLPYEVTGDVAYEIERILCKGKYDLAFFPWPFSLRDINCPCPKVAVFHDFNFKYFFGTPTYSKKDLAFLDREISKWLKSAFPVVSTHFVERELRKFYPDVDREVSVIHLSSLVHKIEVSHDQADEIVSQLKICKPYLLYPTHLAVHKNLNQVFHAMHLLGQKGTNVQLVLTGQGTELANGIASEYGVQRRVDNPNILGLGYVSNDTMNALFKNASAVISSSFYEAGNGPGLDAWVRGVPVIMSNTPPYMEHLNVLGVKARTFDPHDATQIAECIEYVINNTNQCLSDAAFSKKQIEQYTWDTIANKYVNLFKKVVGK